MLVPQYLTTYITFDVFSQSRPVVLVSQHVKSPAHTQMTAVVDSGHNAFALLWVFNKPVLAENPFLYVKAMLTYRLTISA